MNSTAVWKEKFQLSTSYTLREALEKQLINETEYQEWASKYYGLPILEDAFFEKHSLLENFMENIQNIANPSAIPCFEWNDILYVVCLEPQEIPIHQKTVFFITSVKNMDSYGKR